MLKHRRGSLTVEAVLILPIFMAAILFISYFIKAHLVQDIVQDALTEAVVEVSALSYPYCLSGASEFKNEISEESDRRLKVLMDHFEDVSTLLEAVQESSGAGKKEMSGIDGMGPMTPQKMFSLAKCFAAKYALESAENEVAQQLVLGTMGDILSAKDNSIISRIDALGIEGGLDGFDFSGSEFYGTGGLLDVQVQYRLSKVDPFGFIKGTLLKNRVVCRAWMGGVDLDNDGGISRVTVPPVKVGEEDGKKDSDRVFRTCYVIADSKGSLRYHLYDCSSLRERGDPSKLKAVVPVQVEFVKRGNTWVPAGIVVYEGKTYDFCKNCEVGRLRMRGKNGTEH